MINMEKPNEIYGITLKTNEYKDNSVWFYPSANQMTAISV